MLDTIGGSQPIFQFFAIFFSISYVLHFFFLMQIMLISGTMYMLSVTSLKSLSVYISFFVCKMLGHVKSLDTYGHRNVICSCLECCDRDTLF